MNFIGSNDSKIVSILNQQKSGLQDSIRKTASGKSLLNAADDPVAFVLVNQIDSDIGAIDRAIDNTEVDISILQTAEDALAQNTSLLSYLKQQILRALNDINSEISQSIHEDKIKGILDTIDRVNKTTKYGNKYLLNGDSATVGAISGDYMEFISANEKTTAYSPDGFDVEITQRGSQSYIIGKQPLTQEDIDEGFTLRVVEDGKSAEYTTKQFDTPDTVVSNFQSVINSLGLDLTVNLAPKGSLLLYHNQFGSKYSFQAESSLNAVLSTKAGILETSTPGADAAGTVDGQFLLGDGQFLKGREGSIFEGLVLRYKYDNPDLSVLSPGIEAVGKLTLNNNSLYFQTAPYLGGGFGLSLGNLSTTSMGRSSNNLSNLRSLSDVNVKDLDNANSSLKVIENAQQQIYSLRSKIAAAQKHGLEANLAYLYSTRENMIAASSTISDVDYAAELARNLKSQLGVDSASLALKKSFKTSDNILRLLDNPNSEQTRSF